jgi:hypothetical protein
MVFFMLVSLRTLWRKTDCFTSCVVQEIGPERRFDNGSKSRWTINLE